MLSSAWGDCMSSSGWGNAHLSNRVWGAVCYRAGSADSAKQRVGNAAARGRGSIRFCLDVVLGQGASAFWCFAVLHGVGRLAINANVVGECRVAGCCCPSACIATETDSLLCMCVCACVCVCSMVVLWVALSTALLQPQPIAYACLEWRQSRPQVRDAIRMDRKFVANLGAKPMVDGIDANGRSPLTAHIVW